LQFRLTSKLFLQIQYIIIKFVVKEKRQLFSPKMVEIAENSDHNNLDIMFMVSRNRQATYKFERSFRVTRCVCAKIAQNVHRPIHFCQN
jgi:hypothetical protein